jgi:hypothetical protein
MKTNYNLDINEKLYRVQYFTHSTQERKLLHTATRFPDVYLHFPRNSMVHNPLLSHQTSETQLVEVTVRGYVGETGEEAF